MRDKGTKVQGCKGHKGVRAQGLLVQLNREYRDDSNNLSGLKIGPLLKKLWAKTCQSLKPQGHKSL